VRSASGRPSGVRAPRRRLGASDSSEGCENVDAECVARRHTPAPGDAYRRMLRAPYRDRTLGLSRPRLRCIDATNTACATSVDCPGSRPATPAISPCSASVRKSVHAVHAPHSRRNNKDQHRDIHEANAAPNQLAGGVYEFDMGGPVYRLKRVYLIGSGSSRWIPDPARL